MDEKIVYKGSEIELINDNLQTMGIYDGINISTNNKTLILNLCGEMAQKIKDQVIDVIGHIPVGTTSTS